MLSVLMKRLEPISYHICFWSLKQPVRHHGRTNSFTTITARHAQEAIAVLKERSRRVLSTAVPVWHIL
jgi:hypothetical protein